MMGRFKPCKYLCCYRRANKERKLVKLVPRSGEDVETGEGGEGRCRKGRECLVRSTFRPDGWVNCLAKRKRSAGGIVCEDVGGGGNLPPFFSVGHEGMRMRMISGRGD